MSNGAGLRPRIPSPLPTYPFVLMLALLVSEVIETWAPLTSMVRPGIAFAVAIGMVLLVGVWRRSLHEIALAATVLFFAAFDAKIALLIICATGGYLAFRAVRARRVTPMPWPAFTRVMNIIAVFALGAGTVQFASYASSAVVAPPPPIIVSNAGDGDRPDIYVILLDAYARSDTLQETIGYDNSAFIQRAEALGFDVADLSHANYNRTVLTVASTLNAQHINDVVTHPGNDFGPQTRQLKAAINQAYAFQIAAAAGYDVFVIPTQIGQLTSRDHATLLESNDLRQYEYQLPRNGLLNFVLADEQIQWFREEHRQRILASFKTLSDLPSTPSERPRLVFAHILLPHNPIVFAADGSVSVHPECYWLRCNIEEPLEDDLRQALVGQFQFTDQKFGEVLESMVATSRRPPVIVVFGDHGIRHWASERPEAFNDLFMSYTPGRPGIFPESSTPVNIFPRIFNAYSIAPLPVVPDASYVLGYAGNGYFPLLPWNGVDGPAS